MLSTKLSLKNRAVLLTIVLCAFAATAFAQEDKSPKNYNEFCTDYNNSADKIPVSETRELVLPASNLLEVNGERNGGILVKADNRSDILVRACVRAAAPTKEAAQNLLRSVRVETNPVVRAAAETGENSWTSVSYEILVPRQTNLKLTAQNGGIKISGVEGNIEFDTQNGGVNLSDLAGDVRGKTRNGGLHIRLTDNAWRGAGLNAETTNGGVHLDLPATYQARIETGTVNGGFKSDIAALQVERKERQRNSIKHRF